MSFQGLFRGVLLGLLLTGTSAEVEATVVTEVLGGSATFKLDYPESSDAMFWYRNGVHVATLRRGPPCTLTSLGAYTGRIVTYSEDCSSLTVGDLREEDAAEYAVQFQNKATSQLSKIQAFITLKVFKRLSEADLEVDCKEEICKDGNRTLHLNCSAGKWGDGVGFRWILSDLKLQPSSEVSIVVLPNTQDDEQNLTCVAKNPVSNASRTVTLKQACAAGKQSTTRPSTVADTETEYKDAHLSSSQSVVIPVVIVLAILAVIAVVVWRVKRTKAAVAGRDLIPPSNHSEPKDCRSLYVEIGHPQVSDLGTGSPEQGRGPGAPKETPTTIYADVQHPEKTPLQTDDEKIQREKRRAAAKSEKTIYSEISGCDMKEANLKTIYDTVNFPKPPEPPEYNKIL